MQRKKMKENCRSGATLTSNKECPFVLRQVSPDLHKEQRSGFTLIELLVVILIIGILAAVALPQYQKAVEKSKATQALTLLKSLHQAVMEYNMANGSYPTKFDELSVEIPWTGRKKGFNFTGGKDTRSNEDWSLQLYNADDGELFFITRLTGKYKGGGFSVGMRNTQGIIFCTERKNGAVIFNLKKGAFCEEIMKGTFITEDGISYRRYQLP